MAVSGILLDLEGVLYQDGRPIDGAAATLDRLRDSGIAVRFITNTTTRPRAAVVERMRGMGFDLEADEVFSPAVAACRYLAENGLVRVHLAADPGLADDFGGFKLVADEPDAVVMGDLYKGFDWTTLDGIFAHVLDGARLVALHKNRYCRRDGRIALDLGPFVAAVEYAAGIEAALMGKPERAFFDLALADLGCMRDAVVMVGDDPFSDVGGARDAGLRALQVKTGKYRELEPGQATEPTAVIGSIADLPDWLDHDA